MRWMVILGNTDCWDAGLESDDTGGTSLPNVEATVAVNKQQLGELILFPFGMELLSEGFKE